MKTNNVSFQSAIRKINTLVDTGVIETYALGGATAASFYTEPILTEDVDLFMPLKPRPGEMLVSISNILDSIKKIGGTLDGQYFILDGWPFQILPPPTPLVEEAIKGCRTIDLEGVALRIFTAEHLAAVALETGRLKDRARLDLLLNAVDFDRLRFMDIIRQHGLEERFLKHEKERDEWER